MDLEGKRILITAGPTWVPIDSVRVISNVATGKTGILLAHEVMRQGAKVTLLLGPGAAVTVDKKVRILRFTYFDELRSMLLRELSTKKYDVVIHAAAVADYQMKNAYKCKVRSGLSHFNLKLISTPKLVDLLKRFDSSMLAVAFKFEPEAKADVLTKRAKALFDQAGVNLVVANTLRRKSYQAYLMEEDKVSGPLFSKTDMVKALVKKIGEYLGED